VRVNGPAATAESGRKPLQHALGIIPQRAGGGVRRGKEERKSGIMRPRERALPLSPAVEIKMGPKDYRAILSAVEQAIAICDRDKGKMDEARRKICESLHRLREELRGELGLPISEST
jgi:hypothetical protein